MYATLSAENTLPQSVGLSVTQVDVSQRPDEGWRKQQPAL